MTMNATKFLIVLPVMTWPVFYAVVRWGRAPGAAWAASVWAVAFGVIVWWLAAAKTLRVEEHVAEHSAVLRVARRPSV